MISNRIPTGYAVFDYVLKWSIFKVIFSENQNYFVSSVIDVITKFFV